MPDTRRTLDYLGLAAPTLALGTLFLATIVDPKFDWASRSLSSMGEATPHSLFALGTPDQLAFLLFNSGLLLGAVLGLPFSVRLWQRSRNAAEKVGVGFLVVALVAMGGVGIAYLDGPFAGLHFLAAVSFFLFGTFALLAYGTGSVLAGESRRGLAILWAGVGHLLVWVFWVVLETMAFTTDGDTWTYFAVPEAVGAFVFGAFVFVTARRNLHEETTATAAETDTEQTA
ncbi:DUF998 domain-containing protein [Haloarchaeobius sp. HME9146]|uniref:DUF998 domain-containing protein n=1 Tax=Haloarchaeobius sp. HME9146 TaxID=2978732 RepID=UPI0021C173B0|nr:DUF998 domain-containing protein [Haloarchaeobius sp. HME9146]MCT9096585.1 DUF998 domain-containing protein [Haloarchaeobius sp. HME9146]